MDKKEYEMDDDYKRNLAHLSEFLDARESYRKTISDALASGVKVSSADQALVDEKLREFDRIIDGLEASLAEEYDRYQAEMAKEAEIKQSLAKAWESQKKLYIIIKHQKPHLLESFTECLDPLTDDEREQFFDEVAILETTKLRAILDGTA